MKGNLSRHSDMVEKSRNFPGLWRGFALCFHVNPSTAGGFPFPADGARTATDSHVDRTRQQKAKGWPDPALLVPSLATLGLSWAPAVPDTWQSWGDKTSQEMFSTRQFTCRNVIYQVPLRASGIRDGECELAAQNFLANSEVLEGLAVGGIQFSGW